MCRLKIAIIERSMRKEEEEETPLAPVYAMLRTRLFSQLFASCWLAQYYDTVRGCRSRAYAVCVPHINRANRNERGNRALHVMRGVILINVATVCT